MSNTHQPHHGKNFKRMREILGVKQETVAFELGEDWDQKKVSRLEEKEIIPDDLMDQIAKILKVSPDAIRNFDEERAINIITNTFHDSSVNQGGGSSNYHSTLNFNPLERFLEAVEKNEKLYEQLLRVEREKNSLLERLLNEKK
ncbi:transcriptional regulator with XRE-family HTH domain [Filimonas zeae]|uniref:HTH cro/C1-type domain-containing protein n=1 Tax=Filimonas zeae TaxID=1737353 RepID=A0A917IXI3_9BACT|nr:helix-turn-helix domain-containing protein [Filimonas zeae]MDR6338779.1 transcriptional regulator with XRE-family HTH domain [Filimonas zeae]GGH66657.1 hypothetical protein GCM10011379_21050 [Filimonas zeae]